jgi:Zn-dependent alcohol dehydrogenase
VRELVGGVDHSLEAIGRPDPIELAIDLTGPDGQAVLVGMAAPNAQVVIDALGLTLGVRGDMRMLVRVDPTVPGHPFLVDLYRASGSSCSVWSPGAPSTG